MFKFCFLIRCEMEWLCVYVNIHLGFKHPHFVLTTTCTVPTLNINLPALYHYKKINITLLSLYQGECRSYRTQIAIGQKPMTANYLIVSHLLVFLIESDQHMKI